MIQRTLKIVGVSFLLASNVSAQFGVGGGREKASSSEDLQELAQQEEGADNEGDLLGLGNLGAGFEQMAEMFNDPEMAKVMEDAMAQFANMSPEDMQSQMQEALSMLSDGDMVDNILGQKEEVLKSLESSGLVDDEQLERFKSDPEAFEKEMRDAFGQMQDMFSDPALLNDALKGMQDVEGLMKGIGGDLSDDVKIEEARLEILSNPELASNPMFSQLFGTEEFQESLKSETKWREAVKKGQGMMLDNEGAGMREL